MPGMTIPAEQVDREPEAVATQDAIQERRYGHDEATNDASFHAGRYGMERLGKLKSVSRHPGPELVDCAGLSGDRAGTESRLDQRLVEMPAAGEHLADPAREAQHEQSGAERTTGEVRRPSCRQHGDSESHHDRPDRRLGHLQAGRRVEFARAGGVFAGIGHAFCFPNGRARLTPYQINQSEYHQPHSVYEMPVPGDNFDCDAVSSEQLLLAQAEDDAHHDHAD